MKSLSLLCLHSLGYSIFSVCYSLLALHLDSAFRLRTRVLLQESQSLERQTGLQKVGVHFFCCYGPLLDPAYYHLHDRDAKRHDLGDFQWRSERLTAPALEVDKHGFELQFCDQLAVWSGFHLSSLLLLCHMEVITQLCSRAFCLTAYLFEHLLCTRHSEFLYVLSLQIQTENIKQLPFLLCPMDRG